ILDDPIFNGLAVALIFGILVSTLLTLVVIPVLFYAVYRKPYETACWILSTSSFHNFHGVFHERRTPDPHLRRVFHPGLAGAGHRGQPAVRLEVVLRADCLRGAEPVPVRLHQPLPAGHDPAQARRIGRAGGLRALTRDRPPR